MRRLAAPLAVAAALLVLPGSTGGAKPPLPELPSAIKTGPTGRIALVGPWTVRSDPRVQGTGRGWYRGQFGGRVVDLPYSPNAARVTGEAGRRSFNGSVAWYRHTFGVAREGEYALRFESVNHRAQVWLDGQYLGNHVGTYLPFEVHAHLAAGDRHTLVVRADWRSPYLMKREAWHRTWFNFGGINREVTVRPLGASTLSAPNLQTRLVGRDADVTVAVRLRNRAGMRQVGVQGALVRGAERIPLTFPTANVGPGGAVNLQARARVRDAALWQPGSPNLYELELDVPGESGYRAPVGLREIKRRGGTMYLNGHRLTVHGASIHEDVRHRGDALLPGDMDRLVTGLKAIGANATRSQHPLNPALLERLDAAGILVWQGVGPVDAPGAWTSTTRRLQAQSAGRVRATLFQEQTHPSIVAWTLANEVAGEGHFGGQAGYIDTMARELHRRDPGRLVAVDVWGPHAPVGLLGQLYRNVDAIGFTDYLGWYELPLANAATVRAAVTARMQVARKTFAGKVLIVSEFGAEANNTNPQRRPGGYAFQAKLLREHIETYKSLPGLDGMLVWDLRDFALSPDFAGGSIRREVPAIRIRRGINQKGLIDYSGDPKPALRTVAREFLPLGDGLGPKP